MQAQKGKLIVIEGIDSSGKATQTKKLVERLRQEGEEVETYSFPRHGQKFFGILVDQYLNNEFGQATELDPHLASLLYACDRWEVKDLLDSWLQDGKIVVLDRYTTSNMGHQLSKITNFKKHQEFLDWLEELEFETFKVAKPDLVLYLDVEVEIVYQLMIKRERKGKEYINGQHDGHEKDSKHLSATQRAYRFLSQKYDWWQKIKCQEKGRFLSVDQIHEKIWQEVKKIILS